MMGLGLGLLENSYPYYPSVEHRGEQFGAYLAPSLEDFPEIDDDDPREPVRGRAVRREGDRRDGQQRAAAGDRRGRSTTRSACGSRRCRSRPERVLRALDAKARAAPRRQAGHLRRGHLRRGPQRPTAARRSGGSMPDGSGFSTWNGVDSCEFVDGVRLHAIGGDQVLLCRVQYEPGKQVPRHAHEHTEQLMAVDRGQRDDDDRRRDARARAPATSCASTAASSTSCTPRAASRSSRRSPRVPLDHVPDRERDLVLAEGGRTHVER